MKKTILLALALNCLIAKAQMAKETYKFLDDIEANIINDTTPWKYQTGATELSFSGFYKEVLSTWEKNGTRKPKITNADSVILQQSRLLNAAPYILEQSKDAPMIIINEAHHIPRHRTFTRSLLKGLYQNGYRYLGLEALYDSTINERKFPTMESGYYTREPEFGNLIAEALQTGFILFGYDSPGKNGKDREIEQAQNIQEFIQEHPAGKTIVHCGYAHAFEKDYASWGKAMAGRIREFMNIDPLTIDQTIFMEKFTEENNHLFTQANDKGFPVVMIAENGKPFNGLKDPKQTDIIVIHPPTKFINGRPDWIIAGKDRYSITNEQTGNEYPLLVLAYRQNELDKNGVPADILEIKDSQDFQDLYLKEGNYDVIIKNRDYQIIKTFSIEVK